MSFQFPKHTIAAAALIFGMLGVMTFTLTTPDHALFETLFHRPLQEQKLGGLERKVVSKEMIGKDFSLKVKAPLSTLRMVGGEFFEELVDADGEISFRGGTFHFFSQKILWNYKEQKLRSDLISLEGAFGSVVVTDVMFDLKQRHATTGSFMGVYHGNKIQASRVTFDVTTLSGKLFGEVSIENDAYAFLKRDSESPLVVSFEDQKISSDGGEAIFKRPDGFSLQCDGAFCLDKSCRQAHFRRGGSSVAIVDVRGKIEADLVSVFFENDRSFHEILFEHNVKMENGFGVQKEKAQLIFADYALFFPKEEQLLFWADPQSKVRYFDPFNELSLNAPLLSAKIFSATNKIIVESAGKVSMEVAEREWKEQLKRR